MFVVVPASGGAPGPGPPPPRRCFRTPSPSQGRGGAPLVLRATPRPRSPAAGRTEAAECPFLAAVRDLLQGNRRCFCPGWERGAGVPEGEARAAPGQLPQAPLPAADPRPHTHPGGIPHCSGRGRARGVTATPTPNHQRRGTCGIRQGLPFAQLRPALLALGGWRGRRRPRVTGTAEKTSWNPQSRDLRGHSAPPQGLALEPAPQGRGWERAPLGLLCGCRAPALGWREAVFLHERKSSPSGAPGSTGRSAPPGGWEQEGCDCLGL